jgi:succinate dehydrogenase/fumarate reductase flavoprotein subunit
MPNANLIAALYQPGAPVIVRGGETMDTAGPGASTYVAGGKTCDLIVVGAGGSGMIAAAEAARHGLKVIVFEKAPQVGGTTGLSVGTIMAARSKQQMAAGVEDSPAIHASDLEAICASMGIKDDTALRQVLVENVADTVEWLRAIGINFMAPLPQPPHTVARLHQVMPTSRAYVVRLHRQLRKLGVDIRVATPASRLIVEDGTVVGVEARGPEGEVAVRSRAGVILASGDMGGDPQLMHAYMKTWADGVEVYNPANTGDGHKMALAVGAAIVPRKDLGFEAAAHIRFVKPKPGLLQRLPPWPLLTRSMVWAMKYIPAALIRPIMMRFLTTVLGPDAGVFKKGAILVNKRGERIGRENDAPNILIPQQPDGIAYIVFDEKFANKFSSWPNFISTAPGVAFAYVQDYRATRPDLFNVGVTIAELARVAGFDADKLAASIEDANQGRGDGQKLSTGPFYALGPVKTWVLVAPVGLSVNTRFEVLSKDGVIIPGLYAVGHAGMAGFTMTGHGHGLGWAFTSGRLGAANAVARLGGNSREQIVVKAVG